MLRCLAILLCAVALGSCAQQSGDVAPPRNWPIAGLTLPKGTRDADFSPGPARELLNHLPRKRGLGETTPPRPLPGQWNAFFGFDGEPSKVFDHVDHFLLASGYSPDDIQNSELGTSEESRIHTYHSADGAYSVSLRYWKVSDAPGAKPFQLLVRDLKSPGAPDANRAAH